jgi:hypothetical protein
MWLSLILGALLLVAGRRLVWLAVAAVGFAAGAWVATVLGASTSPTQTQWVVALGFGIVGAILAVVLQKLAITVAGAGLGALAAWRWSEPLATTLDFEHTELTVLVAILLGGLAGALLAAKVFALAATLVTAGLGAVLIATELALAPLLQLGCAAVLMLIGVSIQSSGPRESRRRKDE